LRYFILPFEESSIRDDKNKIDKGEISEKLNLISDCIRSSLFLSHNIRKDASIILFDFKKEYLISISGNNLKYMGPDSRSISIILLKAFRRLNELRIREKIISTPGILVQIKSIIKFLRENKSLKKNQFLYYDPKGEVENINTNAKNFFLLFSDLADPTQSLNEEILENKFTPIGFNQNKLLPSEAIVIFNNYLDRMRNE
jgi:tRNA (pseudouridine54-N1)-methyltransferase